MALAIVQTTANNSMSGLDNLPRATFKNAPTPGNLLLCHVSAHRPNADWTLTLTGWTSVGSKATAKAAKAELLWKVAATSEAQLVQATLSKFLPWTVTIMEVSADGDGDWEELAGATASGTSANPSVTTGSGATEVPVFEVVCLACKDGATLSSPTNNFAIAKQFSPATVGAPKIGSAFLTRTLTSAVTDSGGGTYNTSRPWVALSARFRREPATVDLEATLKGRGDLTATCRQTTPTVAVEAAFGYGPRDDTPVWKDISAYGRSSAWTLSGRQNELGQMEAGTGTLLLKDPDSYFDPDNPDSPYYALGVKPVTPFRLKIADGDNVYTIWTMYAERLPRTLRVTDAYTERAVSLTDGFALLASAGLGGSSYPAQQTDLRVNGVLDDIGWPAGKRRVGTGVSVVAAATFADTDDTGALQHLLAVADSENGLLFLDGDDNIVFVGRHTLIQDAAYTTPAATFRDDGGSTGNPYTDLVPSYDDDQVVNRLTGSRTGGDAQIAEDEDSQDDYFLRAKTLTSLVTTDAEVLNQVQWKIGQFSQPLNRVESVTVQPLATSPNFLDDALSREVGERITVLETPPGVASERSGDYQIQRVSGKHDTGPSRASLEITYQLWPASVSAFWVAGDAEQSFAGISTRAGY